MRFGFMHQTRKYRLELTADRFFDDPLDDCMGSKWKADVIALLIRDYIPDIKLGADTELCIDQLKRLRNLCDSQIKYIELGDI